MNLFKKLFFHSLNKYLTAIGIVIILTGIYVLINGRVIQMILNGLSLAGFATVLIGGIMTTAYFGSFDSFGYSFKKVLNYKKNRKLTYVDYIENKRVSRQAEPLYFMPFYVVGIITLVISLFIDLFV